MTRPIPCMFSNSKSVGHEDTSMISCYFKGHFRSPSIFRFKALGVLELCEMSDVDWEMKKLCDCNHTCWECTMCGEITRCCCCNYTDIRLTDFNLQSTYLNCNSLISSLKLVGVIGNLCLMLSFSHLCCFRMQFLEEMRFE